MRYRRERWSRVFLWALIGTVAALVIVPVVMFLTGTSFFAPSFGYIVATLTLLLPYCLIGLTCALARESGRAPGLMRSGMVLGLMALIGWAAVLWIEPERTPLSWAAVLIIPTMWSGLMALLGVLLLLRAKDRQWVVMRRISVGILSLFAAYVCAAVLFYPDYDGKSLISALGNWPSRFAVLFDQPTGALIFLAATSVALLPSPKNRSRVWFQRALVILLLLGTIFVWFDPGGWSTSEGVFYDYYYGDTWERRMDYAETASRIGFGFGLIAFGFYVLTLILAFMQSESNVVEVTSTMDYWLRCPRCGLERIAQTGEYHCVRCGLSVRVELA